MSFCTELEIHPQNHNVCRAQVSAVEATVTKPALTDVKHPQSARWIWPGAAECERACESVLHNTEETSLPTHAHVKHGLRCKEL